jgi:DNA-binding MarR family transcriptional regulator
VQATKDDVRRLAEAVTYLVENAYRGMARTFDVTRIGLLRLAVAAGPVRPSDAAEALAVNPSTITRSARSLEADGLVTASGDPADGRACRITATDEGRAELDRFEAAGADVFASVVHDWSAEDVRRFAELLDRLARAWAERGPPRSRPTRLAAAPRWKAKTTGGLD